LNAVYIDGLCILVRSNRSHTPLKFHIKHRHPRSLLSGIHVKRRFLLTACRNDKLKNVNIERPHKKIDEISRGVSEYLLLGGMKMLHGSNFVNNKTQAVRLPVGARFEESYACVVLAELQVT